MAIMKCKMCGGDLNVILWQSVAECEYCGSRQTVPNQDSEKKLTLFARANRLRFHCEFDKASGIYESIAAEFPEEAEAYWGLVLCKYGIEYVDDPASGKKVPTCHRSSFDSVMEDSDYEQALETADSVARKLYREEAKQIEQIRKGIVEVSSREEPYDIFICYKETDSDGDRTMDSVLAQDIYDVLTEKGYRVFFSRITLEDKLGQEYEPYIFAALNSARVMLVIGTDYDFFNAVWVKNEWSRFLRLIERDKSRHLIPCYKNMDPYDMPREFVRLQAQDLDKLGAIQDLIRGIEKLCPVKGKASGDLPMNSFSGPSTDALMRRAKLYLENGEWAEADKTYDKILDMDVENAEAHVGKLCAEYHVSDRMNLGSCVESSMESHNNFRNAIRFGSSALKEELEGYAESAKKYYLVSDAIALMDRAKDENDYRKAAEMFSSLGDLRAAQKLRLECVQKADALAQQSRIQEAQKQRLAYESREKMYQDACKARANAKNSLQMTAAAQKLASVGVYKDARQQALAAIAAAEKMQAEEKQQSTVAPKINQLQKDEELLRIYQLRIQRKLRNGFVVLGIAFAVILLLILLL